MSTTAKMVQMARSREQAQAAAFARWSKTSEERAQRHIDRLERAMALGPITPAQRAQLKRLAS